MVKEKITPDPTDPEVHRAYKVMIKKIMLTVLRNVQLFSKLNPEIKLFPYQKNEFIDLMISIEMSLRQEQTLGSPKLDRLLDRLSMLCNVPTCGEIFGKALTKKEIYLVKEVKKDHGNRNKIPALLGFVVAGGLLALLLVLAWCIVVPVALVSGIATYACVSYMTRSSKKRETDLELRATPKSSYSPDSPVTSESDEEVDEKVELLKKEKRTDREFSEGTERKSSIYKK